MMEFSAWITVLVVMQRFTSSPAFGERCSFPRAWRGQWYQNGIGEVIISERTISKKGICTDRHRDYYLIQNGNEHCHQCLIIMQRHPNIIQYKESYCIGRDSLHSICAQIRVEAVLHTLVKEPTMPIPCPFEGAYHFTYNNNSGGFCRSPMSYVHQCAAQSKFRFGFRHCTYAAYTADREMELECVASWRDGSDMYLYGRFTGSIVKDKDDMYRCSMYQMLGTVVYISMSADATCRGLRDARDGPMVMEFTKDIYGWPEPECSFPYWLISDSWRDLSGKHMFHSEDPLGKVVHVTYRANPNTTAHIRSSYKCIRLEEENNTHSNAVTVLSYTLDQCAPAFQCLRISQRQPNILELQRGDFVQENHVACNSENFIEARKHLLIPTKMTPRACPYSGRYTTPPNDISRCQVAVTSECISIGRLDILSTCYNRPVAQLECLQWWQEEEKQFLIARRWKEEHGAVNCYSFRVLDAEITMFGTDLGCNHAVENIANEHIRYALRNVKEACLPEDPKTKPEMAKPKMAVVHPSDDTRETQPFPGSTQHRIYDEEESSEDKQKFKSLDTPSGCSGMQNHPLQFILSALLLPFVHKLWIHFSC